MFNPLCALTCNEGQHLLKIRQGRWNVVYPRFNEPGDFLAANRGPHVLVANVSLTFMAATGSVQRPRLSNVYSCLPTRCWSNNLTLLKSSPQAVHSLCGCGPGCLMFACLLDVCAELAPRFGAV